MLESPYGVLAKKFDAPIRGMIKNWSKIQQALLRSAVTFSAQTYLDFLIRNEVIIYIWKSSNVSEEKQVNAAPENIAHISLSIPSRSFYASIAGADNTRENGTRGVKLITSYAEDVALMGGRNATNATTPLRLFHLNIDNIINYYKEKRCIFERANYRILIAADDNAAHQLEPIYNLNCAVFARALLEHGGINSIMNLHKIAAGKDRRALSVIIALCVWKLPAGDNPADKNIHAGCVGFSNLITLYTFLMYYTAAKSVASGQLWVATTPKGVFTLAENTQKMERKEIALILTCYKAGQAPTESLCSIIGLLIIASIISLTMLTLGVAILGAYYTGYDIKIAVITMGVGLFVALPVRLFCHYVQSWQDKAQINCEAPDFDLIKTIRNSMLHTERKSQESIIVENFLTNSLAYIVGTIFVNHVFHDIMEIKNIVGAEVLGELMCLPIICCFYFGLCIMQYSSCCIRHEDNNNDEDEDNAPGEEKKHLLTRGA